MPLAHDEAAGGNACQGCNGFIVGLARCTTRSIEAQVVHLQWVLQLSEQGSTHQKHLDVYMDLLAPPDRWGQKDVVLIPFSDNACAVL